MSYVDIFRSRAALYLMFWKFVQSQKGRHCFASIQRGPTNTRHPSANPHCSSTSSTMTVKEQEGLALVELGTLLEQHFHPAPPNTRKKPSASIYAQVLLPTLNCDEPSVQEDAFDASSLLPHAVPASTSERVKLLFAYAMRNIPIPERKVSDITVAKADKKGKRTARTLAAEAEERQKAQAVSVKTHLLQRIARRLLCSETILKTLLSVTECKYMYVQLCFLIPPAVQLTTNMSRYAGDRTSEDGANLAIYYRCAQAEQEDETTCSGSLRVVFSLSEAACSPHPLFTTSTDRSPLTPTSASTKITKTYGSSKRKSQTIASRAVPNTAGESGPIPLVTAKLRLTHLAKHKRTYKEQKAHLKEQERERKRRVKKLERLLAKLQNEVDVAKASTKLADVSEMLERMEELVYASSSNEEEDDTDDDVAVASAVKAVQAVENGTSRGEKVEKSLEADNDDERGKGKRKRAASSPSSAAEAEVDVEPEAKDSEEPASDRQSTEYDEPDYSKVAKVSAKARKNTSRWGNGAALGSRKTASKGSNQKLKSETGKTRKAKKQRVA